jgi:nucleoside-diphosphate-sugar epimerase
MSATVLVTGGNGFIGAWVLRELLARGCTPVVLDVAVPGALCHALLGEQLRKIRWRRGDITEPNTVSPLLKRHVVSHVIHLVGLLTPACQADPVKGGEVNVLGTLRLFDAVRRRGLRAVAYASSYAAHGPTRQNNCPETFYGTYKRAAEAIAAQYARHFGIDSIGLRPFVVYGAGRTVGISAGPSLAARAAALGESYTIPFSGSAGLVYVEDVAQAFVRGALETPRGACAIDMPGCRVSMPRLVQSLARLAPGCARRLRVDGPPLPPLLSREPLAITSALNHWKPTPLGVGLKRTMEGWKALREGGFAATAAGTPSV